MRLFTFFFCFLGTTIEAKRLKVNAKRLQRGRRQLEINKESRPIFDYLFGSRIGRKKQYFSSSKGLARFQNPELRAVGASGEVWAARDTTLNRDVVVKIFYITVWKKKSYVKVRDKLTFQSEADQCNIVSTLPDNAVCAHVCGCITHNFDSQDPDETLFIIMPDAGAKDLSNMYSRQSVANQSNVVVARSLMLDILKGIQCLDEHNPPLIHHDLKPANIALDMRHNTPKASLVDFGAMLASDGDKAYRVLPASPPFTPPEFNKSQVVFALPAHSYDVYAAGLLYAWMLCAPVKVSGEMERAKVVTLMKEGATVAEALAQTNPACRIGKAEGDIIASMVDEDPKKRPKPATLMTSISNL